MAERTAPGQNERAQGFLGRAWRRLVSSNDELDDADLQRAAEAAGAQPIQRCKDRETVTLSGTISSLTQSPRDENPNLVVDLRDGSGSVRLTWIGRRSIPGVECGQQIRVHGRISCHDGVRAMYNPRYELLAGS